MYKCIKAEPFPKQKKSHKHKFQVFHPSDITSIIYLPNYAMFLYLCLYEVFHNIPLIDHFHIVCTSSPLILFLYYSYFYFTSSLCCCYIVYYSTNNFPLLYILRNYPILPSIYLWSFYLTIFSRINYFFYILFPSF